jgi:hypothetical protein
VGLLDIVKFVALASDIQERCNAMIPHSNFCVLNLVQNPRNFCLPHGNNSTVMSCKVIIKNCKPERRNNSFRKQTRSKDWKFLKNNRRNCLKFQIYIWNCLRFRIQGCLYLESTWNILVDNEWSFGSCFYHQPSKIFACWD